MADFKLTKAQKKELAEFVEAVKVKRERVVAAIEVFNKAIEELHEPVKDAMEECNDLSEEFKGWIEENIVEAYRGAAADKSEKWHEEEKAQAVEELVDAWEAVAVNLEGQRVPTIEPLEDEFEGDLDDLPDTEPE